MVRSKAAVHKDLARGGWGGKWFKKAKNLFKKHAKKHIAKAKKYGKQALKHGKKMAVSAGKELLNQAKEEAKNALKETAEEAMTALHGHVKSTVCGAIGAGFFSQHKTQLRRLVHKEFDGVHKKALAHARTGKNGAGLDSHVNKATKRVEAGVERIKNNAKAKIRAVAGCDDEGAGLRVRGAGLRVRGAGVRRKKKGGSFLSGRAGKIGTAKSQLAGLPKPQRAMARKMLSQYGIKL